MQRLRHFPHRFVTIVPVEASHVACTSRAAVTLHASLKRGRSPELSNDLEAHTISISDIMYLEDFGDPDLVKLSPFSSEGV
jgi:hypothetical protein